MVCFCFLFAALDGDLWREGCLDPRLADRNGVLFPITSALRRSIADFGVLKIIEGTGLHPAACLIDLGRSDEINWAAVEEKSPWFQ